MPNTLKNKVTQLIHCISLAKLLGYDDLEYTFNGYSLMKHNSASKQFKTIDEAEKWLERSFEINSKYRSAYFRGNNRNKKTAFNELESRMNYGAITYKAFNNNWGVTLPSKK